MSTSAKARASALKGQQEKDGAGKGEELKVFISSGEVTCGECGEALEQGAWISLAGEKGALCLACADLDHLLFLPSGDAALTRRARSHSVLWAVVLKWSHSRKRYERQGLLVEAKALEKAEAECLADAQARERKRERQGLQREKMDQRYLEAFAQKVRELFPGCPRGRETEIAGHACLKYSGRVGRSASAKALDELAVIAHIRHRETPYDRLLAQGYDRSAAREAVGEEIIRVLQKWQAHA
jgi:hypothetical protein